MSYRPHAGHGNTTCPAHTGHWRENPAPERLCQPSSQEGQSTCPVSPQAAHAPRGAAMRPSVAAIDRTTRTNRQAIAITDSVNLTAHLLSGIDVQCSRVLRGGVA